MSLDHRSTSADIAQYRVRESIVSYCNGFTSQKRRMFLAERRVSFLRIFAFWWPTINSGWRTDANSAWQDARNDLELRQPLQSPIIKTSKEIRGKLWL